VRVAFGDCTLDSETRELFRNERPAHLSPKAFRLLELLLEGRPRALSKAEIHQKIWPEAFVSEATLASLIAEIREAIGDGKDARFIDGPRLRIRSRERRTTLRAQHRREVSPAGD
jgi:DNA-binding winged helix-turn-helix (wHTH) protein